MTNRSTAIHAPVPSVAAVHADGGGYRSVRQTGFARILGGIADSQSDGGRRGDNRHDQHDENIAALIPYYRFQALLSTNMMLPLGRSKMD